MAESKNVFVVAPTELHLRELQTVAGVGEWLHIHPLLTTDDVVHTEHLDIAAVLQKARDELDRFDGAVDAIIAHWDFPTTMLVPILCHERELRSPSLASVVRAGHKYWSRVAQREAIEELTPSFELVDPFAKDAADSIPLDFPFWLKPVKAFSSQLGFCIHDRDEFEDALERIRAEIGRLGEPWDEMMAQANVPSELRLVGGSYCIAEEYLKGVEIAHEGYVQDGQVIFHGTLDMIRKDEVFTHYLWPSTMPDAVIERMEDATSKLLHHIGFDDGCFNAEFFWDQETDRLSFIEVNPRISQSHSPLCILVDGRSNHEIAIDVALGQRPLFDPCSGPYEVAGKFLERVFHDGVVKRVPSEEELKALHERYESAHIDIAVAPGQRLSELKDQDAYSFEYANVYMAAHDRDELLEKHERLLEELPVEIEPLGDAA